MAVKNSDTKARFLVVGSANTAIDFGLLFILQATGLPVALANIISTTTAFCFSFFANKKYTFKTNGTDVKREIILFVVITLFGLWVLQTIAIKAILSLVASFELPDEYALLVAKVGATIISLTWNYILYSRVVFKHDQRL